MLKTIGHLSFAMLLLLAVGVAGCSDDCETCPTPPAETPALAFVGSQTCGQASCHASTYAIFIESGHPYKLTEVVDGASPTYPWDDLQNHSVELNGPPPGTSWNDYAYVIGGYGWKARWVKPDGNVYTTGEEAQLNLWAPMDDNDGTKWVPYTQDQDKPYNQGCFRCHTTGASTEGSWPEGSTGFGTFAFGGVQCEACHGQGSQHASNPQRYEMTVDSSSELCGQCHYRDAEHRIAVSGGFIRHHEQYDEMIHSPHATVGCNACHDPHAGVVYDDVAMGDGIKMECLECHTGYDQNFNHNGLPDCTDCHMPLASKSARKDNDYIGDVSSHLVTIRTTNEPKDAMWTSDGKFVALDEFGRGSLTLDFACFSCHGPDTSSPLTLDQLSAAAQNIHNTAPVEVSR